MTGILGSLIDRHRPGAGDRDAENTVQPRARAMFENEWSAGSTDSVSEIDAQGTARTARQPARDSVAGPFEPRRTIDREKDSEATPAEPRAQIDLFGTALPSRRDRRAAQDPRGHSPTTDSDAPAARTSEINSLRPEGHAVAARIAEVTRQIDRELSPVRPSDFDAWQDNEAGVLRAEDAQTAVVPRMPPLPDSVRGLRHEHADTRSQASPAESSRDETIVNVSIGRIEIRGEKPDTPADDSDRARGVMSLDEYLARRTEERG